MPRLGAGKIDQREVHQLLSRLRESHGPTEFHGSVGDMIRLIDGPLTGYVGTVASILEDRHVLRVTVAIFGRQTPIELDYSLVQLLRMGEMPKSPFSWLRLKKNRFGDDPLEWQAGDRCRIVAGPLEGMEGSVEKVVARNKLDVLVHVNETPALVELKFDDVERL